MFRPIGAIIGKRRFGKSSGAVYAIQIKSIAEKVIGEKCADLPPVVLGQIKVKTFKNGTLTVACPTLVAAELYMRSSGLKKAINKQFGRSIVKDLRFRAF